jgi:acetyl-CoA carboxylase biotin carboxyl carrier protein
MDLRELRKLITLMNENGLSRLEVQEEGKHYRLEKGGGLPPEGLMAPPGMAYPFPQGMPAGAVPGGGAPAPAPAPPPAAAAKEDTITFNSPMVGTFYSASSPEAEPFVKPGDRITKDSVLCIIEAMKVFNEIKSDVSGTVIEVLTENAEAVEYGQPLFLVRPS